jgi:hypothetical protein
MRVLKKELWPYKVEVKLTESSADITAIEIWLGAQLGAFKGLWNMVYHYDHTDFYFRNSGDATLFALKWT